MTKQFTIIVAGSLVSKDSDLNSGSSITKYGIGYKNTIPWMGKLPNDMKHFREVTTGGVVIMGRKTYQSLPGCKPLPNRKNIVISTTLANNIKGITVCTSFEDALKEATNDDDNLKIFIIGGQQIYNEALQNPNCNKIILTQVYPTNLESQFNFDTWFNFDYKNWKTITQSHPSIIDNKNIFSFEIHVLEKIQV